MSNDVEANPPPGAMATHHRQMTKLEESRAAVPRYLFRAFSSDSGGGLVGLNSEMAIRPHAFVDGASHTHINDIDYVILREMVDLHFQTKASSRGSVTRSEFSSWASSVALALHYASMKMHGKRTKVHVCVIDRMHPELEGKIRVYYSLNLKEAGLTRSSYPHEYLIHGIVTGPGFKAVPALVLKKMGLYDEDGIPQILEGERANYDKQHFLNHQPWWEPMTAIAWKKEEEIHKMTKVHIKKLRSFAKLFGPEFEFVMTVAFSTVARRHLCPKEQDWDWITRTGYTTGDLEEFEDAVKDLQWEKELCGARELRKDDDYHFRGFPTVEQMYKLMYDLVQYREGIRKNDEAKERAEAEKKARTKPLKIKTRDRKGRYVWHVVTEPAI